MKPAVIWTDPHRANTVRVVAVHQLGDWDLEVEVLSKDSLGSDCWSELGSETELLIILARAAIDLALRLKLIGAEQAQSPSNGPAVGAATQAHTPGPWRIGTRNDAVISDVPTGARSESDDPPFYGGYLIAESVFVDANRRLIAVAPDLLAACKEALRHMDKGGPETVGLMCLLEDAIAKAEGRST